MRSMTGYGKARIERDGRELTVEIKSVNHRFLDPMLRLPRAFSFAEDTVRKKLSDSLVRGHAEVNLQYVNRRTDARTVILDEALARQYAEAFEKTARLCPMEKDGMACFIASQPEVITVQTTEENPEELNALLTQAMDEALAGLCAMRTREGEALRKDLETHLNALEKLKNGIEAFAPEVPRLYKTRLENRLKELGVNEIDEQRLAQEIALMADKCAIDEELSRLDSHISQMRKTFESSGETGRKLDFLTQELNREVNTIGSKASDARITQLVVEAKCEIEKIREQVQNVE